MISIMLLTSFTEFFKSWASHQNNKLIGGKSKVDKEFPEFLTKQMCREASSRADIGRVGMHQLCPHISVKLFI